MSISELISIASTVIAIFSFVYARRAVLEAKKSNEISLHSDQLKVYRYVQDFSELLSVKGPRINQEDVKLFNYAIDLSEFYFDATLTRELYKISKMVEQLVEANAEWASIRAMNKKNSDKQVETFELKAIRFGLCHKIQNACDITLISMKVSLKIKESNS